MRPLWEAYLIEGLEKGRAVCFFKVHHSVMDGVGSLAVFDALTQAHRAEPVRVPRHLPLRPPSSPSVRLARLVRDAAANAASGLGAAATVTVRAALRPLEVIGDIGRTVRGVRGMITDLTAPSTADPLAQASTGIGRRLDAMTLSLPRLERVKEALGVTLNDVMLTAVSGAVGRYYAHRKMHVEELHCMVPMSLRQSEDRHALGNRVGAFNVALPIGESDPVLRLARIQRQTGAAKSDRRGAAWPLMMRVLASMPGFAYRLLAQAVTGRVNLICTNIPGPSVARYLAGAKIDAMYPFAPVALGTPLSIALMSYGDSYGVGVDTDPAAIPDPELLTRYLAAAVDEIEERAVPQSTRGAQKRTKRLAAKGASG
jgi:diacylglycerol O-acyltransferase